MHIYTLLIDKEMRGQYVYYGLEIVLRLQPEFSHM